MVGGPAGVSIEPVGRRTAKFSRGVLGSKRCVVDWQPHLVALPAWGNCIAIAGLHRDPRASIDSSGFVRACVAKVSAARKRLACGILATDCVDGSRIHATDAFAAFDLRQHCVLTNGFSSIDSDCITDGYLGDRVPANARALSDCSFATPRPPGEARSGSCVYRISAGNRIWSLAAACAD